MISVCMATYNGERFLREQIDSILCQLSPEDELIISDDGSTDGTLGIIGSYNDARIRLLRHEKKAAYAKIKHSRNFYYATDNFENALKAAKGEYIFLSDQDDVWMENKRSVMCTFLDNFDCVMCNNQIINAEGKALFLGKKSPFSSFVLLNLKRTPFLGCCMGFSRRALEYILPFPKNLICHDLWMGCLCAYKKSMIFLQEPLHKYRYHDNSVSPSVTKNSKNSIFFRINYRIIFLIQFYSRLLTLNTNRRKSCI